MNYQDYLSMRIKTSFNSIVIPIMNMESDKLLDLSIGTKVLYPSSLTSKCISSNLGKPSFMRLLYLTMITIVLASEIVNADLLFPVSANTGSSASTSIGGSVDKESKYLEYPSGLKACAFLCTDCN